MEPDSLGGILPQFLKVYGPVHKTDVLPFGPNHSSEIAFWWYGDDVMQLEFATIPGEAMTDPRYRKDKTEYLKVVRVDMWRL